MEAVALPGPPWVRRMQGNGQHRTLALDGKRMTTNTNDLTGRALDEAAARAMGWKKPCEMGRCDDCGWPLRIGDGAGCFADRCCMYWPDGRPIRADTPPQFTEREMLA